MKILVASDIHGSLKYAKAVIDKFKSHNADRILLLGDILYHGPRNPLPEEYNPMEVAILLNEYKSKIFAVRGNCDSEVDQMVIDFNISQDYLTMILDDRCIYASHGHIYHPDNIEFIENDDVFIFGHIHLPIAKYENNKFILNPGSITLPKENNPNSFGILNEEGFKIYNLNDEVIKEISFNR